MTVKDETFVIIRQAMGSSLHRLQQAIGEARVAGLVVGVEQDGTNLAITHVERDKNFDKRKRDEIEKLRINMIATIDKARALGLGVKLVVPDGDELLTHGVTMQIERPDDPVSVLNNSGGRR